MEKDRINGSIKQAVGGAKVAAGNLSGNKKLQVEGKANQAEGKVRNTVGGLKDTIRGATK